MKEKKEKEITLVVKNKQLDALEDLLFLKLTFALVRGSPQLFGRNKSVAPMGLLTKNLPCYSTNLKCRWH